MRVTSFKNGSKNSSNTEYYKDIYLNINGIDTKVGLIGKTGWGEFLEYRVYFFKNDFDVASRSKRLLHHNISHNLTQNTSPNKDESVILMQTYDNLKEANGYAKRVFKDTKTLKTEMFNVYLKLLQALG